MNYNVVFYVKGENVGLASIEAKSHKEAAARVAKEGFYFVHAKVVGAKTTKRFVYRKQKMVEIKDPISIFKCDFKGHPALLMMIGIYPEFKRYASISERDEVFSKCTELIHAESAEEPKEPTNITASTEGTYASKNGLTLKKTLNGFVMSATCKDLPTRTNTVKSSIKSKYEDTAKNTWSYGSSPFPSKQNTSLWAKVNIREEDKDLYPHSTTSMKSMNGDIIKVTPNGRYFSGGHFMWNKKWLQFDNIELYLLKPVYKRDVYKVKNMDFKAGKGLSVGFYNFSLCTCGCGLYEHSGTYVKPRNLSPKPIVVPNSFITGWHTSAT